MEITAINFPRAVSQLMDFEQQYKLPQLSGTTKQVLYARDVRQKYLRKLLPSFLNEIASLSHEDKSVIYQEVDRLRNLTEAKDWIDQYQQYNSHAMKRLLTTPQRLAEMIGDDLLEYLSRS